MRWLSKWVSKKVKRKKLLPSCSTAYIHIEIITVKAFTVYSAWYWPISIQYLEASTVAQKKQVISFKRLNLQVCFWNNIWETASRMNGDCSRWLKVTISRPCEEISFYQISDISGQDVAVATAIRSSCLLWCVTQVVNLLTVRCVIFEHSWKCHVITQSLFFPFFFFTQNLLMAVFQKLLI